MSEKVKSISIILLIWFIAGLLYSAQSYYYRTQIGQQVDSWLIVLIDTPYFLFWAFFTPIPVYFFKRIPFVKTNLLKFFVFHIVFALAVSFAHAYLYNSYRLFISGNEFSFMRAYINAIANFDYGLLVYFVVLLVFGIYDYYMRYQQVQTALVQAQLETVRMKLQPHFLFNTLNSIAVLIKESPKQAAETIKSLSDLLRHILKNMENNFTELDKELNFLKKYLSIEQVRFGSRLQIRIDIDKGLNKIMIPSLILQPLVENAVQHGIATNRGKGSIEIQISKENEMLKLTVKNNGKLKSFKNRQGGMGLKITRDRLKSIYNSDFKLNLTETAQGHIQAEIIIPVIKESAE